jgi:hypothetical protein
MERKYFISYAHEQGFGNCFAKVNFSLSALNNIQEMEKIIQNKYQYKQFPIILYWKRKLQCQK